MIIYKIGNLSRLIQSFIVVFFFIIQDICGSWGLSCSILLFHLRVPQTRHSNHFNKSVSVVIAPGDVYTS